MNWVVHTEWLPLPGGTRPHETALASSDQPTAERTALHVACLAGVRYIAVVGPADTVTLDWDRYTNKARRYGRYLGICGNEREELDGQVCTGHVYAPNLDVVETRCFECGARDGVLSPPRRPYWEALTPRAPKRRRTGRWGDLGGRGLLLRTRPDADLYVIWSTIADGPMWIGPEAELVEVLGAEYADRLPRARENGTSSMLGEGGWDYSGFVADQRWLPRARLHEYVLAHQEGGPDAAAELLDPADDDTDQEVTTP